MPAELKLLQAQLAENNEQAFRTLFHQFSGKVFRFALKITHDNMQAEEITQEVFMKIWMHREAAPHIDCFPSYIYTITRNLAFNFLKRLAVENRAKAVMEQQLSEFDNEMEESIFHRDHLTLLDEVVEKLPPQQRLVYSLCHREGLKYDEVAEQLHISRLTVQTHMKQALRTIRANLTRVATLLALMMGVL